MTTDIALSSAAPSKATASATMPQRRICQLLHGLPIGGAEVLAYRLAKRLGERHSFVFICLDELGTLGEALRDEGFPVHVLNRRPGIDWRCIRQLAGLVRRERIDLVHAHQYTPFFYAMSARVLASRTPVLFTEHGRWHPDYPRAKRIWFNRIFLQKRDRVVGVGEAVRQALIANEGISPGRVGVIYNGIDLSAFHNGTPDRLSVRQELGLKPDDFVIAQVARLDGLKDHPTAVRTMARVAAEHPSVRLLIVGEGPERERIEAEIAKWNVAGSVRMLGLRRDIHRILAASDAFLLTSISEGVPLTLIEAMAAGLPIVSTKVGGVGEVVRDSETAILAAPGDDHALAKALLRLLGDAQLRSEMGRHGRSRAHEVFSEDQMHAEYSKLYESMLTGHGRANGRRNGS